MPIGETTELNTKRSGLVTKFNETESNNKTARQNAFAPSKTLLRDCREKRRRGGALQKLRSIGHVSDLLSAAFERKPANHFQVSFSYGQLERVLLHRRPLCDPVDQWLFIARPYSLEFPRQFGHRVELPPRQTADLGVSSFDPASRDMHQAPLLNGTPQ